MKIYKKIANSRICQGDIIRDAEYIENIVEKDGKLEIKKIIYPLIIVLTQDCDLEQDYKYRIKKKEMRSQLLVSVLVAPLYNADHVFQGEHLSELGIKAEKINKKRTQGEYLMKNEIPRFHYLNFPSEIPIVQSIIDFKHYFSLNVEYLRELKRNNFVCSVNKLFREDISQRFSSYLSRIGLPLVKTE